MDKQRSSLKCNKTFKKIDKVRTKNTSSCYPLESSVSIKGVELRVHKTAELKSYGISNTFYKTSKDNLVKGKEGAQGERKEKKEQVKEAGQLQTSSSSIIRKKRERNYQLYNRYRKRNGYIQCTHLVKQNTGKRTAKSYSTGHK